MRIKPKDIFRVYKKTLDFANKSLLKEDYNNSVKYANIAACIAVYFNWMYSDSDLEDILKKTSIKLLPPYNKESIKKRVVFYDFRAADNCCLTQQYLKALMDYDMEILYIPEVLNPKNASSIIKEISSYHKAQILQINEKLILSEKIKFIYNAICDFRPEKIFIQLAPWSAMAVVVFNAFPTVPKYYINLNDHSFNVGTSCTDYSIEFRNRGCTVAIKKRGLSDKQLLYLPFYPITYENIFGGFPKEVTENNVVLLSGGSKYKIHGDDNKFLKIVDRLLSENPKLIFVYAGGKNEEILQQFKRVSLFSNRIFLLEFRKDINEVFKHCDIYLNTYPFSGGLMCQYAAVHAKPILAYNTVDRQSDFVEGLVCDSSDLKITFTNVDELCVEAKRLIEDMSYRINQGLLLKEFSITPNQFSKNLYSMVFLNQSTHSFKYVPIDYEKFFDRYLQRQNEGSRTFKALFLSKFRLRGLIISPKMFILSLSLLFSFILHPINNIKKIIQITSLN